MRAQLLLSVIAADAYAFELTTTSSGAELRWDPPRLDFGADFVLADPAGERFAAAVRAAFDTWSNGSGAGLSATWIGPRAVAPGDGANATGVVMDWDERFGDAARTVAHTELRYDASTGRMLEADVLLNGESFLFGDGEGTFDAESVVLHEAGHVLGIAHSCGDPGRTYPSCFSVPEADRIRILEAVMAPTLAPASKHRALAADDLAALAVHYGGAAAGPLPSVPPIVRDCPSGAVRADGPGDVMFRRSSGGEADLAAIEVSEGDLIVRDPSSMLYGVVYLAEEPEPCAEPPMIDQGCDCSAERGGLGGVPILLVVALVLLGGRAEAFVCSRVGPNVGPSLVWETRSIPWFADGALLDVYGDRAAAEADVRAAFLAWEDVPCSDMTFPLQAIEPGLRAGYSQSGENRNVVVALSVAWPYDPGAIAITTSAYDTRSGVVVDADIELNAEHFDFRRVDDACDPKSGTMDLRNTVTHEAGHIIGLDHPPRSSRYEETTMFASAPPCETKKQSLEEDDVDGLCSIYPIGNPTRQCYAPDGPSFVETDRDDGFGCTSVRTPDALALALVILLGLRARRGSPSS
jgi:hypothetical protein